MKSKIYVREATLADVDIIANHRVALYEQLGFAATTEMRFVGELGLR